MQPLGHCTSPKEGQYVCVCGMGGGGGVRFPGVEEGNSTADGRRLGEDSVGRSRK